MSIASHLKNLLWKWRGIAIAAPSISLLVIGVRLIGAMEPLELAMLDQFFRWRSPEPEDPRIVIIGIDEEDVRQYKWPIDDALLAKLLDKIRQQKPRAIGIDLARDLPVGKGYDQLEAIFKTTPNIIGATKKADLVDTNFAVASSNIDPPPALAALNQIGGRLICLLMRMDVSAEGYYRCVYPMAILRWVLVYSCHYFISKAKK